MLSADAKILYTTYQIISGTELTLGTVYPTPFAEATQVLKMTELSFITVVPFDCLYRNYSYFNTFNASTLGPLVLFFLLIADFFIESKFRAYYNPHWEVPYVGGSNDDDGKKKGWFMNLRQNRRRTDEDLYGKVIDERKMKKLRRKRRERRAELRDNRFTIGLLLSYLVLPTVSTLLFSMYNCLDLYEDPCVHDHNPYADIEDDDYPYTGDAGCKRLTTAYLINDLSIRCKGNEYEFYAHVLTPIFIMIYPVGMPLTYLTFLYYFRHDLNPSNLDADSVRLKRNADKYLQKIRFLWNDYHPRYYYFEFVEAFRRLALTGMLVTIRNRFRRVIVGFIMALMSFVLYREAQPFIWPESNLLASVCQMQLIITFFMCLLIQTPEFEETPTLIGTVLLGANIVAIGLVIVLQFKELKFGTSHLIIIDAQKNKIKSLRRDVNEMEEELNVLLDRHYEAEERVDLKLIAADALLAYDDDGVRSQMKGTSSRRRSLQKLTNKFSGSTITDDDDDDYEENDVDEFAWFKSRTDFTILKSALQEGITRRRRLAWKRLRCLDDRIDENFISFNHAWYPCYVMNLVHLETAVQLMTHEEALGNEDLIKEQEILAEMRRALHHMELELAHMRRSHEDTSIVEAAALKACDAKKREIRNQEREVEERQDDYDKSGGYLEELDQFKPVVAGGPVPERCIYISHEWSRVDSEGNPIADDHRGTKLAWIQNLRKHLNLESSPTRGLRERAISTATTGTKNHVSSRVEADGTVNLKGQYWIWWDVFSMPKKNRTSRVCAMMSLPYYIASCGTFLPLLRDPAHWENLYLKKDEEQNAASDLQEVELSEEGDSRGDVRKGSFDSFWEQGLNRLEILIALCPKTYIGNIWRIGPSNLRYRMHEDPLDSGIGPKVTMKHLKDPVGGEARYKCCDIYLPRYPLHDCDKAVVSKVVHYMAKAFNDYARSGATEWNATAMISSNVKKDRRPDWLVEAALDRYHQQHSDSMQLEAKLEAVAGARTVQSRKSALRKANVFHADSFSGITPTGGKAVKTTREIELHERGSFRRGDLNPSGAVYKREERFRANIVRAKGRQDLAHLAVTTVVVASETGEEDLEEIRGELRDDSDLDVRVSDLDRDDTLSFGAMYEQDRTSAQERSETAMTFDVNPMHSSKNLSFGRSDPSGGSGAAIEMMATPMVGVVNPMMEEVPGGGLGLDENEGRVASLSERMSEQSGAEDRRSSFSAKSFATAAARERSSVVFMDRLGKFWDETQRKGVSDLEAQRRERTSEFERVRQRTSTLRDHWKNVTSFGFGGRHGDGDSGAAKRRGSGSRGWFRRGRGGAEERKGSDGDEEGGDSELQVNAVVDRRERAERLAHKENFSSEEDSDDDDVFGDSNTRPTISAEEEDGL